MVGTSKPTWIVAVSGGIDSIVLLDILHKHSNAKLIVAHIDHGIRGDGYEDRVLVQKHAARVSVHLELTELHLGSGCDEETARIARYAWLESVCSKHGADAIVTAHHQDDVLETIIINHIRGTGWRGLASLRSHETTMRPLIHMSKARIIAYAIHHKLDWREDATNEDVRYLRNAIRHLVVPRLSVDQRRELFRLYECQSELIGEIDSEIIKNMQYVRTENGLSRYWLTMVSESAAIEILQSFIATRLQKRHARQLLHFVKSARAGAELQLPAAMRLRVTADDLIVSTP